MSNLKYIKQTLKNYNYSWNPTKIRSFRKMSRKGYDVFFSEPERLDEINCKVCGSLCRVERDVLSPTGWAEAMTERGHWHDYFYCPHRDQPWHEQALELVLAIENTPSKRIAELMRLDLEDLLKEQGCL
jgi:hypothetical protein